MKGWVEGINPKVLVECREQAALSLEEVSKKVTQISAFEAGTKKPTFNQLDKLSKLYHVPRWVFISGKLPEDFRFEKVVPAFRQFKAASPELFANTEIRTLTASIEQKRSLLLDLFEDMDEPCPIFDPPQIPANMSAAEAAKLIRPWLEEGENHHTISEWKQLLEKKGVFIFLTSKYKGWSHIDRALIRGLSIYHEILPIIIINDSDAKKAQSFTLFHEFGHLIRKENAIDDWRQPIQTNERWCDDFAGNILMPEDQLKFNSINLRNLKEIKKMATIFKVSPYAMIVRLRRLQRISLDLYEEYEWILRDEFKKINEELKKKESGPRRNRANEVINQFGGIYVKTLFQAYYNKEIGLKKLIDLFRLKQTSYLSEIESKI